MTKEKNHKYAYQIELERRLERKKEKEELLYKTMRKVVSDVLKLSKGVNHKYTVNHRKDLICKGLKIYKYIQTNKNIRKSKLVDIKEEKQTGWKTTQINNKYMITPVNKWCFVEKTNLTYNGKRYYETKCRGKYYPCVIINNYEILQDIKYLKKQIEQKHKRLVCNEYPFYNGKLYTDYAWSGHEKISYNEESCLYIKGNNPQWSSIPNIHNECNKYIAQALEYGNRNKLTEYDDFDNIAYSNEIIFY